MKVTDAKKMTLNCYPLFYHPREVYTQPCLWDSALHNQRTCTLRECFDQMLWMWHISFSLFWRWIQQIPKVNNDELCIIYFGSGLQGVSARFSFSRRTTFCLDGKGRLSSLKICFWGDNILLCKIGRAWLREKGIILIREGVRKNGFI